MKKQLRTKKKSHFFEYLLLTVFTFAGIGLLSFILFNVSVFNPFTQAFRDFTLTDLYYTRYKNVDSIYNGPLVLINVENRNRDEIAFLVQRIEEGKPKVVGMDIIFADKRDSASDALLKETFARYNNIIHPHIASFDSSLTEQKDHEYFQTRSGSFVNLIGENREFSTIRYYYPVYNRMPSFTTAVMQMYDSAKAASLFRKGQKKTEIKYFGNLQNFYYHTFNEVMNPAFNTDTLKDKIVLIGYMGAHGNTISLDEDRFFTPLNPRLSGRSHPDMYGSVIHANILRMSLDKDYIFSLPQWANILIAFMLTWTLLPVFVHWYVHKPLWYHLWLVLSQFIISILFVFLTIVLYSKAKIKIESASLLVAIFLIADFLIVYDALVKFFKHKLHWKVKSKFLEGAH